MPASDFPPSPSRISRGPQTGRGLRLVLTLALLAAFLPALLLGRQAGAQDEDATPGATPDSGPAGTVAGMETATVVPADALLFAAITLDPDSDQIGQSQDLLDRAGLGDLLDQAFAGATDDVTASSDAPGTAAAEAVATILDGEAAVVVTDAVVDVLTAVAEESAGALPPVVSEVTTAVADAPAAAQGDDDDATPDVTDPLDNLEADSVEPGDDGDGAILAEPLEPLEPGGVAAVLRPGDPDAAAETIDGLLQDAARARDVALDETEVSGITVTALLPDEFGGGGAAVTRLGDLIVVATNPDDLEPFIAVSAGDAPALDADPAFVRARTELPDDFLAFGYVNGPAIRGAVEPILAEMADDIAAAGLPFNPDTLAQLDAHSAFIVRADTPGFRFETATFAAEGGTLPAIPAGGETTLDASVPADTLLFVDGFELGATLAPSLDSAALTIAQLAMQDPAASVLVPEGATEEEQIAAVYDLLGRIAGFNPRTSLVDQLTGEWAFALTVRSLTDPSGVGAVFTSGVDDETLVNDATTKLAAYLNIVAAGLTFSAEHPEQILAETEAGTQTEVVGGGLTQIVTIPIPPTTDVDAASDAPSTGTGAGTDATQADAPVPTIRLQWGIVDGRFVFGVNEGFDDLVEGADGGVLADNPRYQAVMAELPEAANGVVYLDLGQLIELLEPILYGDEFLGDSGAAALPDPDDGLATPVPSDDGRPDLSGIEAFAAVGYERGDVRGVSALLLIGE